MVLGSFCDQACHDTWHAAITARQAASKMKYDNRQPEMKIDNDPNPNDADVRQCFHCLQPTPDYLTLCDKCGRCKYHPDGGEVTSSSKHTFQKLMEMSEGLIRPSDRPRRELPDYGMRYPLFTVTVIAAQHSYSANATFRRNALQHFRKFVTNQSDESKNTHGEFKILEDWWHSLPD